MIRANAIAVSASGGILAGLFKRVGIVIADIAQGIRGGRHGTTAPCGLQNIRQSLPAEIVAYHRRGSPVARKPVSDSSESTKASSVQRPFALG